MKLIQSRQPKNDGEFRIRIYETSDGSSRKGYFDMVCPRKRTNGRTMLCSVPINEGADLRDAVWNGHFGLHGWDGNMDAPTIIPSIGCDARCGLHQHVIRGERINA